MVYPVTYTFTAANTTYVCAAQTRNGAGALTLNGSGVDAMSTYLKNSPRMKLSSGFEQTVSITSAGITSTVTFTITGKDIRGATLTENVTGPNTTTSYTAGYFYEVNSVTANGTVSSSTSVGIGTTGRSQWYKVDYNMTPTNIGLGVTVSGTDLTWTMVQTTYNVETAEPAANSIINNSDTNLVTQTTSRQGNYAFPFGAARCNVTASTNGTLTLNMYQAGIV